MCGIGIQFKCGFVNSRSFLFTQMELGCFSAIEGNGKDYCLHWTALDWSKGNPKLLWNENRIGLEFLFYSNLPTNERRDILECGCGISSAITNPLNGAVKVNGVGWPIYR